jgi:hypothetical protein
MADWPTIASLATAGGTLVLAVATFSSVRAGRRSTRIAERSTGIAERALSEPRPYSFRPFAAVARTAGRRFQLSPVSEDATDEFASRHVS